MMEWINLIVTVILGFMSRHQITSRVLPFRKLAKSWTEKRVSSKNGEVESMYPIKEGVLTGEPRILIKKEWDNRSTTNVWIEEMLVRVYIDRAHTGTISYKSDERDYYFKSDVYEEVSTYPSPNGTLAPGKGIMRFSVHVPSYFLNRKEASLYIGLFGYIKWGSAFGTFNRPIIEEISIDRAKLAPPVLEI